MQAEEIKKYLTQIHAKIIDAKTIDDPSKYMFNNFYQNILGLFGKNNEEQSIFNIYMYLYHLNPKTIKVDPELFKEEIVKLIELITTEETILKKLKFTEEFKQLENLWRSTKILNEDPDSDEYEDIDSKNWDSDSDSDYEDIPKFPDPYSTRKQSVTFSTSNNQKIQRLSTRSLHALYKLLQQNETSQEMIKELSKLYEQDPTFQYPIKADLHLKARLVENIDQTEIKGYLFGQGYKQAVLVEPVTVASNAVKMPIGAMTLENSLDLCAQQMQKNPNLISAIIPIGEITNPIGGLIRSQHFVTLVINKKGENFEATVIDSMGNAKEQFGKLFHCTQNDTIKDCISKNAYFKDKTELKNRHYLNHQSILNDTTSCGYFTFKLINLLLKNENIGENLWENINQASNPLMGINTSQQFLKEDECKLLSKYATDLLPKDPQALINPFPEELSSTVSAKQRK